MALDSRQLIMRFGNSPCQISPKYRMGKAGQNLEPKGKRLRAAQSPWEVSYWLALMARSQCLRNNTAQKISSHSWLLALAYVLSFWIPRRLKQEDCLRPGVRGQPRQNSRVCFSKETNVQGDLQVGGPCPCAGSGPFAVTIRRMRMTTSVRVNTCLTGGCGFEKHHPCMHKHWEKPRGLSTEFATFCEFIIISK